MNPRIQARKSSVRRSDAGSNLVFGPDGQITFAKDEDNLSQPAVVSPNLVPQNAQSTAAPSQILQSTTSQPLVTSTQAQSTTSALLGTTSTPTGTPAVNPVSVPSSATPSFVQLVSTSASALPSLAMVTTVMSLPISSIPATSAVEVIASATTLASPASASPSASATNTNTGHGPSFYVGIVVGTIIIIACLAALVAWWIRIRSHARRRRLADDAAGVPWAKPENRSSPQDDREVTYIGSGNLSALGPMGPSSQRPMAWEPRGDRDVGEPKRTDSFLNGQRSATPYNPFAVRYPILADNATTPLPLYNTYATMQSSPSHLRSPGTVDGHASTLGPLQVANQNPGDVSATTSRAPSMLGVNEVPAEFGTPHQSMAGSRPRFLGLDGGGLRVPWAQTAGSFPRGMSFTSRRGGYGVGNWEHLPGLPTHVDSTGRDGVDSEGWTASLKTNLMNAFNAVAAGLPSAPTMEERQENYLTPSLAPHASRRGSLHRKNQSDLSAHRLTRQSTASSKHWSLEERLDGTGTVHFHGLEGYRGADHAFSPLPAESALTLQDGDIGGSIFRLTTHESQTPLIANKKPKNAVLRPGICGRVSRYGYGRKPGLVSRASSVYSTVSGASSVYGYPSRKVSKPRCESMYSRKSTRTCGISSSSEGKGSGGESRMTSASGSFNTYSSGASMDEVVEAEREMMEKGTRFRRVI